MSTMAAWATIAVCLAISAGVVFLLLRSERGYAREVCEAPTQVLMPVGWDHSAPAQPLTVPNAHRVMQQHRSCLRADCPRKRAAWQTLVEAQHVTPDSGREF
ncbi:hypothetical protein [Nocardia wallacei]|uniref:hypothetical protein n=1 Tax=Nocardia wallacei TaxID=480035 RepID=UPI00245877B9|nr:hypothetical protein [Nocardia wallacei]